MKKNKFVKLIEHLLVAMPLFYLAITSAYTIFNPNANESFDNFILDTTYKVEHYDDFSTGLTYQVVPTGVTGSGTGKQAFYSACSLDFEELVGVGFTPLYLRFNADSLFVTNGITYTYLRYRTLGNWSFTFEGWDTSNQNQYFTNGVNFYVAMATTGKLNNVLPYAMSEFNKLGFNKIPFTSFFVNIFHNGETNVYIDFVNNYLNYMLFVECSYFVPMILYWFIHFGEEVIDRFTRKGDKL